MGARELRQYLQLSVRKLKACTTMKELRATFGNAISPIGLQQFAYTKISGNVILFDQSIHTYAADWIDIYVRKDFARIDPVLELAQSEADPFYWSAEQFTGKPGLVEYFRQANGYGLSWGVATRLKTSSKTVGILLTCSASSTSHRPQDMSIEQLTACCRVLSETFHQSALVMTTTDRIVLRPREQEVLELSALGMSGTEIALIIGVSPIYVAEISRNLIQKFGVRNKLAALWRARELDLIGN
uniref:autoinducer binding domain-containing protein n=1 Tax=Pararhizobium sp. IMCC3301 TaxID=3067904 RepID=UPI0027427B32|nr:autoinducer binding domain-containing protein [Pararhizobium sp. IMCC3301]